MLVENRFSVSHLKVEPKVAGPLALSPASTSTPTVSVIIPARNEAANLPHVLPKIPQGIHEVILVDGHSTDDTIEVAQKLLPNIRIVNQEGRGKGDALTSGFAAATGDIIVMLDADGSMAPEEIPLYVSALLTGADFVKGSRFLQGGGTDDMEFYRYLGNLGFTWIVRLLFGGCYSDLCYGYAAFWRRVLPVLDLKSQGFEIETEMNVRALKVGLKVMEMPSFESARIYGSSNLNTIRDGFRVLRQIVKERLGWHRQQAEQVRSQELNTAFALLEREAKHLMVMHKHLSPQAYALASEALELTGQHLREVYEWQTA